MNAELKAGKQAIRGFMQVNYSDERLAMLLAHARDGKLLYVSCCCFIGIATADHALKSSGDEEAWWHYEQAQRLTLAAEAEEAFYRMGLIGGDCFTFNQRRIRRLIPIVKAEMRRRERGRALTVNLS